MKQIFLWLFVCYALLLLLPLVALGSHNRGSTAPSPESAASSESTEPVKREEDNFKVLDTADGTVYTYNARDLLIYTVAAEMYPSYHAEALKAQAVASYTFFSYHRARERAAPQSDMKGADVSSMPKTFPAQYSVEGLKKRWGKNFDKSYAAVTAAVDAVLGQAVYYDGKPAFTAYHAISFGKTESSEVVWQQPLPYLKSVESPADRLAPAFESEVSFPPARIREVFGGEGVTFPEDTRTWFGKSSRSDAGTVLTVNIGGKAFTGKAVREALSLRSACFTVSFADGNFLFRVQGYGHGVGMSQYGANMLAGQSMTYAEILRCYYPGTDLKTVY